MADFDVILRTAFPNEYPRLVSAVQEHPNPASLAKIFVDLAGYVNTANAQADTANSKKRKLDNGSTVAVKSENGVASHTIAEPVVDFECKDVSFQIPARKKLRLQVVSDGVNHTKQEIRLYNQQSNELEYAFPGDQADQVFLFPVPEKQQRQWNICVFPKQGGLTSSGAPYEHIVFTLNETTPAGATIKDHTTEESDTYVTVTELAINRLLQPYGKRVVKPKDAEFASSIPQPHRKGEKAYHVKAHRGSKEGYLFFVENGVVFGFKKPLSFFPFSSIESISYTSVLQRTFNLVITTNDGDGTELKEIEFSMLDQADFAGIDEYIKRHGLNDASMAADRRAKEYNVNKEKKDAANGDVPAENVDEDGRTELERAEQELQDAEDEEEEDYEASGGESDGEGEDTSDEEDGEGGDEAMGDAEDDDDE